MITFTPEDILGSTLVIPSWYRVLITDFEEARSKDQKSMNYVFKGKIVCDADSKDETFKNVPTPYWGFNSGAKSFAVGFLKSQGEDISKENSRFDLKAYVGREVEVFIENDIYNDRNVNKINHKYRPNTW